MAYITQEQKKIIAGKLKTVVPKGWTYTLRIRDYSTIIMTIAEIPTEYKLSDETNAVIEKCGYVELHRNSSDAFYSNAHQEILEKIWAEIHSLNHDDSDSQVDYFDVGYYAYVRLGSWDKPLRQVA